MQLTPHFSLEELIATQHRGLVAAQQAQYKPFASNLRRLAQALEDVRARLGVPMSVSSGFRCPELNAAVGGVKGSAHLQGLAADFIAPQYGPPHDICRLLGATDLPYDQIIHEMTWVHFGLAADGVKPRRQLLTLIGPGQYQAGIVLKSA